MYGASVLPVCINGAIEHLGYLGGLRVQPAHRRRIRHLREGYASIRRLAPEATTLPWWFTVVAKENDVARRLLESGVAGLPRYRAIGNYTTYAIASARGRSLSRWRRLLAGEIPALLIWHRQLAAGQQLSPVLDEQRIRKLGLDSVWVCIESNAFVGLAVLWNQSAYKQVVARRYRGALHWLRPAYNGYARLARRIVLPAQGCALEQSFIAFLTLAPQVQSDRDAARDMLADLLSKCSTPVATLGLHDEHPLLPTLLSFRPMRYSAQVYAVEFDDAARLDGRPVQPEAALL
jgi:hypothetical protein